MEQRSRGLGGYLWIFGKVYKCLMDYLMFGMWFRMVVVLVTSWSFRCGNWCLRVGWVRFRRGLITIMWGRWYGFHVIYLWVVWFAIKMLWMLL